MSKVDVQFRELEWAYSISDGCHRAFTILGEPIVIREWSHVAGFWISMTTPNDIDGRNYPSVAKAKAAAQSWHNGQLRKWVI